jgi:glycosyltransferase involved in cell wall biosynthesis
MTAAHRPRVVYWNNQPTPYVVARFNAVAQRGTLDFEAWFDGMRESDRSWDVDTSTWRFPARMIPTRRVLGRSMALPTAELDLIRPDVLVCNYDRLNALIGAVASRAVSRRTALRCLPSFDAWTPHNPARDLALHVLFRGIDGAKVPGRDGAAYAGRYGLPTARTWPVAQSIDVAHYASATRMDPAERARRRAELGLSGCVFVYVGRMWSGKGVDTLVDAYRKVRTADADVRLLLAGDGVDEARLRKQTADLPDVVWAGFVQPAELPEIYALADVMVFPTLGDPNGLVVEEAMAAGLPIISTSAAGDIRTRIPEGVAGHIVPPSDAEAMAARMIELAAGPQKRVTMGRAGTRIAARFEANAYAEDFERFVTGVLAEPRRRNPIATTLRLAGRAVLALSSREPEPAALLSPGSSAVRTI